MIQFNLSELLVVFHELLPLTDEEQKVYWLQFSRQDGITVRLAFSVYEETASMIVRCSNDVAASFVSLKHCSLIRVLDEGRKTIEIISEQEQCMKTRCFLALEDKSSIFEMEVG